MIKKGDKVICIKEHIHYRGTNPITHNKNGIYQAVEYDYTDSTVYITAEERYSDDVCGLWFSMDEKPETPPFSKDIPFVKEYFILLAEWREKQINSILDE